jgi:membrane protein required for colicin V production
VSPFDWLTIAVVAISILLGLWRGLVYEVLSLLGWAVAFWAAQWFAPALAPLLPMSGAAEPLRFAAGFVLVFVGALFAWGLVSWTVKKLISASGLQPTDRALGALFGLGRSIIIMLALAVVVSMTPLKNSAGWRESYSGPFFEAGLAQVKPVLPSDFAKYLP